MAVVDAYASLALSTVRTAASFTEQVAFNRRRPGKSESPGASTGADGLPKTAIWSLQRDGSGIEPLDDALLSLLKEFDGREDLLDVLRGSFELRVRCYGSSNSEQGGFWLSGEVMRRLGRLGVEFPLHGDLGADDPDET